MTLDHAGSRSRRVDRREVCRCYRFVRVGLHRCLISCWSTGPECPPNSDNSGGRPSPADWERYAEKVRKAQAAHGVAVIEVAFMDGRWQMVRPSKYARRYTARTPFALGGPAAGHALMKTAADPDGRIVLGTLNNCGSVLRPPATGDAGVAQPAPDAGATPVVPPSAVPAQPAEPQAQ